MWIFFLIAVGGLADLHIKYNPCLPAGSKDNRLIIIHKHPPHGQHSDKIHHFSNLSICKYIYKGKKCKSGVWCLPHKGIV